nr:phage late control D family protein [Burkholderia ubonensis]
MNVQDLAAALRGGLIQQDRLLRLDTPLGPNALVVQRAVGRSTIGRDYTFTLDVVSPDGAIELKRLIAQPATLWIQQATGEYRPIHGYVYTARRLGADGGLTTYQITLQAWMHVLKFRRDQKIWIDKTVEDIVSDVLNQHPEASGRFRFALSESLPNRSYTRQSETDWNFVHRLLESEGLFGYWEQADDGRSHTLVITDRPDTFPQLSPKTVAFYRSDTHAEADAFTQWSGTRTLQSVTLTTRTFDYKSPSVAANPADAFRLQTSLDNLSVYRWGSQTTVDYFCPICGILPFRKPSAPTVEEAPNGMAPFDGWAVNTRCLEGFDPSGVPVRRVPGSALVIG